MSQALRFRLSRTARRLSNLYPTEGADAAQQVGMRMMWWNGVLASASGSFYGDFVVIYMLALGATAASIGVRSSIASAAALLAPLLGAWLVERTGKRKLWVLLGPGTASRLSLLFMGLAPFLFRDNGSVAAIVGLIAVQSFADTLSVPAANSLLGDIVPIGVRGRFLSVQMITSSVASLAIVPLAGWLIKQIGGVAGYQFSWSLAAIVGFAATWIYGRIPEPPSVEKHELSRGFLHDWLAGWRVFGRDKRFLTFCAVNFVWNFGISMAGPFFSVHQVQDLGFGVGTIALLATVTRPVNIIAVRLAGELVDRKGAQRIMSISMLLVPLLPIIWIFARTPLHVGLVQSYGFLAWAGFHIALTPLLLSMAPPEHRSRYIAMFNTINSLAAIIAPLAASWVYVNWGFTANCLFSGLGRGLGGLLFWILIVRQGAVVGRPPEAQGAGTG